VRKCINKIRALGYCNAHYQRKVKYGRLSRIREKQKGKICKDINCIKPAKCKSYCNVHYNKYCSKPHWKMYNQKYDERRKEYTRKYRKEKGIKSISAMHKIRFGGLREEVIKRDNEKCVDCGMTRQEHKDRWGRDITVDHIDGNGRNANIKNHDIINMQTMCLRCHGRKDIKRARPWLYRKGA